MNRIKKIILGCCLAVALISATTVYAWPVRPRITLAWDANAPADNVVAYTVYWGRTGSREYTQFASTTNTTLTLTDFERGVKYWFAVTASNAGGLESDYSGEVSYTFTPWALPPPAALRIESAVAVP